MYIYYYIYMYYRATCSGKNEVQCATPPQFREPKVGTMETKEGCHLSSIHFTLHDKAVASPRLTDS